METVMSAARQGEAEDLLRRFAALGVHARSLCGDLSDADLLHSPAPGAWSVAEVLEHLVLGDRLYLDTLRERCADARARGRMSRGRRWKASLVGGLLERSLRPAATRKMRAPRVLQPGPSPRPGALGAYLAQLEEIAASVRQNADLDWQRVRLTSPVSRLVRMNLGDAYHVLASHGERHLGQIERAREALAAR
jgi:uncharacterized damage-inducible protein DinB